MYNPFGGEIFFKTQTGSTMDDALEALDKGYGSGSLCWTLHQNQGRGRMAGRKWFSSSGDSLPFTLILDESLLKVQPSLSIRLGYGLAGYLEEKFKLPIKLKWPNDVYCRGGKLSGILCEYRRGVLLAGMGLNLNQQDFPTDLPKAVSLAQLTGSSYKPDEILQELLPFLKEALLADLKQENWNSRLMFFQEEVEFLVGNPKRGETVRGILKGISPEGALKLQHDPPNGPIESYYSGEIILHE